MQLKLFLKLQAKRTKPDWKSPMPDWHLKLNVTMTVPERGPITFKIACCRLSSQDKGILTPAKNTYKYNRIFQVKGNSKTEDRLHFQNLQSIPVAGRAIFGTLIIIPLAFLKRMRMPNSNWWFFSAHSEVRIDQTIFCKIALNWHRLLRYKFTSLNQNWGSQITGDSATISFLKLIRYYLRCLNQRKCETEKCFCIRPFFRFKSMTLRYFEIQILK